MPTKLIDRITDKDNFKKAYNKTRKGDNKYKTDAMIFAQNKSYNLEKLRQSVKDGSYQFGSYFQFIVYEPKERVINAPGYKDKLVQMALHQVLKEVYFPKFIYDSYSCIDEKGTHNCAMRIHKFMQKAKWMYGDDAAIIKIDIKKFFYTIDREVLKTILVSDIGCEDTLKLIYKIIDSADVIDDLGLPLGNSFSQMGANICMNKTDQYAKRKLGLKFYVRYADDIVIIVENKERAKEVLESIRTFVKDKLNLELSEKKTKIFPLAQGVNAIGYKIYPTHMLLRNDCKKKIKRKVKAMPRLILKGEMRVSKAEQMLNSWKGHADYANNYNFIQSIIKKHSWIYLDAKGRLKIDKNKLYKEGELIAI